MPRKKPKTTKAMIKKEEERIRVHLPTTMRKMEVKREDREADTASRQIKEESEEKASSTRKKVRKYNKKELSSSKKVLRVRKTIRIYDDIYQKAREEAVTARKWIAEWIEDAIKEKIGGKNKKLTQVELADRYGCEPAYISTILSGKKVPSADVFRRLLKAALE